MVPFSTQHGRVSPFYGCALYRYATHNLRRAQILRADRSRRFGPMNVIVRASVPAASLDVAQKSAAKDDPGAEDLYDVINERYEKASIVLTSNRDRSEWPELFGEALLASAALDVLNRSRIT